MKKKNLYYYSVIRRMNLLKGGVLGLFLLICSWPRTFIENFTRRNLGERYFSLPLCLFLAFILAFVPKHWSGFDEGVLTIIGNNLSWYAYLVAYLWYAFKRYREVRRAPGAYDLARYSLSAGSVDPLISQLDFVKRQPDRRLVAIVFEPAIFLIGGLLLILLKQPIGYLLAGSAVIYSLSWWAQYYTGDEFVLDKIDEMIVNEELVSSFVHNAPPEETKGFEFYGRAPSNPDFRRKVADQMVEDEPAADVF